ncbi:MAG TPA: hypothetical protein VKY74_16995 [Chloroflexia bacterium]|nr:hypothetical protein [Chloroflexia bacterium]
MPNEVLISQLDQLRDTYAQKQKAVAGLQAGLKAVTDAHGKAQKALREVSAQHLAIDVDAAQQAFARARLKEEAIDPLLPDLRRDLKSLAALSGALRDAAAALRTEPVDVVRLEKARTVLQASRQPEILDRLPELGAELDLAQRGLGDEFGGRLRTALAEQGITIGGRAPKFEIGRFELEANFAKRALVLRYGKDVVVPHIPITVEAAMRAYQGAAKAIAGRNLDGAAWIAQFHDAYQVARHKRGTTHSRVNIVECYLELVILRQSRAFFSAPSKHTFVDYTRAQFIYDFYEFTNRRRQAVGGQVVRVHVATKSQAEKPALSMWIVEGDTPYDGRYFADVEFAKD